MVLKNKPYDILKWVALIVLPATASLYLGLGQLWEWPDTDKVATSIVLVDTFLGALLQLSNIKYKADPDNLDGYLDSESVDPDTGMPNLKMVVTKLPDEILEKDVVKLKVGPAPKQ